jgi:hypothetical protein
MSIIRLANRVFKPTNSFISLINLAMMQEDEEAGMIRLIGFFGSIREFAGNKERLRKSLPHERPLSGLL